MSQSNNSPPSHHHRCQPALRRRSDQSIYLLKPISRHRQTSSGSFTNRASSGSRSLNIFISVASALYRRHHNLSALIDTRMSGCGRRGIWSSGDCEIYVLHIITDRRNCGVKCNNGRMITKGGECNSFEYNKVSSPPREVSHSLRYETRPRIPEGLV